MLNWIKRHKILFLILAVVLALCILLSISYTRGNLGAVSNGIETANSVVQKPLTSGVNWIKDSARGIFRFRAVVRENEELEARIEELEKQNIKLQLNQKELEELQNLSQALNYQAVQESAGIVTGDIVAKDGSHYFNLFTIGCGTETGIAKDCIVVNGSGLVGMIREAGSKYAKVVSIVDESSSVSFRVLRDMDVMGIVSGDGNGMLGGYSFNPDADINEGDVLITSGIGVYPAGIEIGTVKSVVFDQDTQLKVITVEPAVSFNSIKKVTVLI